MSFYKSKVPTPVKINHSHTTSTDLFLTNRQTNVLGIIKPNKLLLVKQLPHRLAWVSNPDVSAAGSSSVKTMELLKILPANK